MELLSRLLAFVFSICLATGTNPGGAKSANSAAKDKPSGSESTAATDNSDSRRRDASGEYSVEATDAQSREDEFRSREEPKAIEVVAKKMRLSEKSIQKILEWRAAFRCSAGAIWANRPRDVAESARRRREVKELEVELTQREMRLLGKLRFYEFVKLIAHEMNRRRWASEGAVLPDNVDIIKAD